MLTDLMLTKREEKVADKFWGIMLHIDAHFLQFLWRINYWRQPNFIAFINPFMLSIRGTFLSVMQIFKQFDPEPCFIIICGTIQNISTYYWTVAESLSSVLFI